MVTPRDRPDQIPYEDWQAIVVLLLLVLRLLFLAGATVMLPIALSGFWDAVLVLLGWTFGFALVFGLGVGSLVQVSDEGIEIQTVGYRSLEIPGGLVVLTVLTLRSQVSGSALVLCRKPVSGRYVWLALTCDIAAAHEAFRNRSRYRVAAW